MKVLYEIQQSFKNTLWVPPPNKTIVPSSRIDTEVKSHEEIFLHLSAKNYLEKMCLVHKRTEVIISSNSRDGAFRMFHIRIYFIQYLSNPGPLYLYRIFVPFIPYSRVDFNKFKGIWSA